MALSQGYSFAGQSGCGAQSDGSQAVDTPALTDAIGNTPPAIPSIIDQLPCD